MGQAGPTEERVGPQVNPEGRVPGILQLGVGPWGLAGLCFCRLSALPVRGPSAGGGLVRQPRWPGWAWVGAPGDTRPVCTSHQGAGAGEPWPMEA